MEVALGLKARTGRAVIVVVGGSARDPRYVERSEFRLLPDGALAPYHAAAELEPSAARSSVERSIAAADRLAVTGLRDAVNRLIAAGHAVRRCGVLVGTGMPDWSTQQILAVHVRMHQAEGELFRNVLVEGARANELSVVTLPEKSALFESAKAIDATEAQLAARLALLGKAAGPPWGKDQKEAAAAALVALAGIQA